jgi:hypothetical protein
MKTAENFFPQNSFPYGSGGLPSKFCGRVCGNQGIPTGAAVEACQQPPLGGIPLNSTKPQWAWPYADDGSQTSPP